jgi:hypothetical protein
MEVKTIIRSDTFSKIATVFSLSERGELAGGETYWSEPIKVQRFINLSCELIADFIPIDTTISIQTSRYLESPTTDDDWFTQDSYTWDPACNAFKYVDPASAARWFRVKIDVGSNGNLKQLAWCFGGKNI